MMAVSPSSVRTATTCNTLLRELQQIWMDIGENEAEKDRMLMELERECLEVYRRKVDEAATAKARLHQAVAAKEAELATLIAALGDLNTHFPINIENKSSSLKAQLAMVTPLVEDLKLKDIAASLFELWQIMDSTREEKSYFSKITSVIRLSEAEIVEPAALSLEVIEQASQEVERLSKLKASRMKELVMKRRSELEAICLKTHIEPDPSTAIDKSNAMIDSAQISKVKDEALSRKEIMDRIERWLSACEEERWLEDYNLDQNRYSAGRGAHLSLKRAERARIAVNKIPTMVDNLISKTIAWENEKNKSFLYDGVRLVTILEEYKLTRLQKEEEKKRFRDQKKLQDLLLTERESIYGSKPSPRRASSFRMSNGHRGNGNGSMTPTPRRNSVASPTMEPMTPRSYSGRQNGYSKEMRRLTTAPLNFVAIPKEDTISFSSVYGSEPGSPLQN
ncbi:hypothetical protein M8C21_014502 [Ambrosia artemisiifolia]|uniref:65-kDa microtubule-associated protein 6 n=1 Tax=Ambrosia artemisiifolia TaxID=4212 RepID=A0AAD5D9Q1_AMBAR|nr:hypothetical protein M8C21_014502 [Ambrosia artemisiifolia]